MTAHSALTAMHRLEELANRHADTLYRQRYQHLAPQVARERIRKAVLYGHLTAPQGRRLLALVG